MQHYTVGRDNPRIQADIRIPRTEDTVGRMHMELSCLDDGRYYIVDQGAVNKTKVLEAGAWREITDAYVELDTPIMLGAYQTTVRSLLALSSPVSPPQQYQPVIEEQPQADMGVVQRPLDVVYPEPPPPTPIPPPLGGQQGGQQDFAQPPMVQNPNQLMYPQQAGGAYSVAPTGQPLGKIRGTGSVILLWLVTFGVYQIIWLYKTFDEIKNYRQQGWSGGTYLLFQFVPVLHLVTVAVPWLLPSYVGELYREDGRQKPITGLAGFWIFVPLAGWFIWIAQINSNLNEFWRSKGALG